MTTWRNLSLIAIVSFTAASALFAQPSRLKLDQIWLEQGLSQSTVYAIVQDAQGFMWFGTDDGLNRYDGYSIAVFKHDPLDSMSLIDNTVGALMSDRNGDLWIGTLRGGADRYVLAENKFYHYRHSDTDSTTISDDRVTCLFEDSQGTIWIGTSNGLNQFNHASGKFRRYQFDPNDTTSLSGDAVHAVCEDLNKNLWVATSSGLSRTGIDSSAHEFIRYHHVPSKPNSLSNEDLRSLYVDRYGTLWVGTWGDGVNRLDKTTNTFKVFVHRANDIGSISGNLIRAFCEDANGNLWIATYDAGLNMFDHESGKFTRYTDEPLLTLYKDRSEILWIGTLAKGVKVYDRRKNRFKHYYDAPNDLSVNIVFPILEDRRGELWVGTYGSGLKLFSPPDGGRDRERKRMATYVFDGKNPYSLSSNRVVSLSESIDGSIWVGTDGGGVNRFDRKTGQFIHFRADRKNPNSISSDQISILCYDRQSDLLYIGHNVGGFDILNRAANAITHYRPDRENPSGLSGTAVTAIYKGARSGLWIGTLNGIVHRFVPDPKGGVEKGSFTRFPLTGESNRILNNSAVFSIYEDEEGVVWMGTYGGGLKRFDPATNDFESFTEQNGLCNNVIYGILPDKEGHLWLSTNKGLSRFNPKTVTFRNYDMKDGLQGNEFNQGAYFASQTGELFFGGVNGFNSFLPEEMEDNKYVPPVYLTSFKVFDKSLQLPNSLAATRQIGLSYSQNFFSFEFVALNYTSPEKNQYAYKLEGFDEGWHEVTASHRYASYTNLNPGEYLLRVKGSNNDGVWNEAGSSTTIVITPPFWMTWWFRSLLALSILLGIGSTIRYTVLRRARERMRKVEQEAALERERLRIARDMHDDLGAKVTEISILSELAKKKKKKRESLRSHIDDISSTTFRVIHSLDEIVWAVNPQNDTLERLIDYIIQHAERFLSQARIGCRLDIPTYVPFLPVPSDVRHNLFMVIQEALNNTVKHARATEVQVRMAIKNAKLTISLQDNGEGFRPCNDDTSSQNAEAGCQVDKFSTGLSNMHRRMETIGGSFHLDSALGKGTEVTIEVPLTRTKRDRGLISYFHPNG